uniref:DUF6570 domain-containing protein n=1 Tax=Steinernema glaseri TaxID=37863 RepID=A0A1I7XY53_9BILA
MFAVVNGNVVDEVPPELRDLNWIEECLIQLIRPIQNIKHLTDMGGRTTAVKSTKGIMVKLPVPVESTIEHVAETRLPSARGLTILVRTGFERRLVSLEKVLRALRWLKTNNVHYRYVSVAPLL